MFNQIRRIWADTGSNDKDFSPQEEKLKVALEHLKEASTQMSKAADLLLHVLQTKGN